MRWPPGPDEVVSLPRARPVSARAQLRAYVRAIAPGNQRRRATFVLFAQGRSGSTLLQQLLSSHPDITCDGEILDRHVRFPAIWVRACAAGSISPCWGFKLKPYHLTLEQDVADVAAWLQQWHAGGWQVVHLVRRNVVRQVMSNVVRNATGITHRTAGEDLVVPRVAIDVDGVVAHIRSRVVYQELERTALQGIDHECVVYEDDLVDPVRQQQVVDRVADRLGLAPQPVSTNLARTSVDELRHVISNFDELEVALRGSGLEDYLHT